MTATLSVRDLVKTYGSGDAAVRAVQGASFMVHPGEFVAVVGPSGSGKTTLLAMIGGLLTPTSGTIRIGDLEIGAASSRDLARYRRERVGFVFQQYNLVPYLTARENVVAVWLASGRVPSAIASRAAQLLEELGMIARADALPAELSGGERQRVAICRALVNDPDLLLVDEPTASLNSARGHQVVELLAGEIKTRGKVGVMVTHDLAMTEAADRLFEMHDGVLSEPTGAKSTAVAPG